MARLSQCRTLADNLNKVSMLSEIVLSISYTGTVAVSQSLNSTGIHRSGLKETWCLASTETITHGKCVSVCVGVGGGGDGPGTAK